MPGNDRIEEADKSQDNENDTLRVVGWLVKRKHSRKGAA